MRRGGSVRLLRIRQSKSFRLATSIASKQSAKFVARVTDYTGSGKWASRIPLQVAHSDIVTGVRIGVRHSAASDCSVQMFVNWRRMLGAVRPGMELAKNQLAVNCRKSPASEPS